MKGVSKPGSGRPSGYNPGHAASLRKYFEGAAIEIDRRLTAGERSGLVFPTASAWRASAGVSRRQFESWAAKHEAFKASYLFAKQLQRDLSKLAEQWGFMFSLEVPNEQATK